MPLVQKPEKLLDRRRTEMLGEKNAREKPQNISRICCPIYPLLPRR
jgi:hypothetical protein